VEKIGFQLLGMRVYLCFIWIYILKTLIFVKELFSPFICIGFNIKWDLKIKNNKSFFFSFKEPLRFFKYFTIIKNRCLFFLFYCRSLLREDERFELWWIEFFRVFSFINEKGLFIENSVLIKKRFSAKKMKHLHTMIKYLDVH